MIQVIIADDHIMLREGLQEQLKQSGEIEVLGQAGTAAEILERIEATRPHVVILDLKLPDAQGFTLIRKIKRRWPNVRIVVLTMYDHARYALHALESGADGFVIKGAPFDELLKGIKTVHRGGTYVCSQIAPQLIEHLRPNRNRSLLDSLSRREFETLTMLSGGMSLKDTAIRMGISQKTVCTYRSRLMSKLSLSSNADLVKFALESGVAE